MKNKKKDTKISSVFIIFIFAPILLAIFLGAVYHWANTDRKLPRLHTVETNSAIRGAIITQDEYIVSNSTKLYKVSIDSRSIDKHKLDLFVKLYCIYTGDSEKRVKTSIKEAMKDEKGTIVLSYNIDAKTAVHLKELSRKLNLKKVFISFKSPNGKSNPPIRMSVTQSGEKRTYSAENSLTPIIGYIKKNEVNGITRVSGVKGVEKFYEYYLNPVNDEMIKGSRDIGGNIILEKTSKKSVRTDGYNLHISIPLKLQKTIETMVDERAKAYDAKEIVVGIMNSKTGQILSLVTNARYNPNEIRKKDFSNLNLSATEYAYETGSIVKPLVWSVAYEAGKVKPKDIINTHNGAYKLASRTIKDTHPAASMSATEVIMHSSNIGMIEISKNLEANLLREGLLKFGLAQLTGIDLPYEQKGNLPNTRTLANPTNKAVLSYGYGFQATFIQMLSAYNAFNNDGIILSPKILQSLELGGKFYKTNENEPRSAIDKETAGVMKEILIQTVENGTGKKARTAGLEVGGKTGTARIAKKGVYVEAYNSSFFGFANDEKNSYTIGVFVREPKQGSFYAAQNALPVFKKVVDILVENGYLTPNSEEKVVIKDEKLDEIKD